jgi:hypothetical protein
MDDNLSRLVRLNIVQVIEEIAFVDCVVRFFDESATQLRIHVNIPDKTIHPACRFITWKGCS